MNAKEIIIARHEARKRRALAKRMSQLGKSRSAAKIAAVRRNLRKANNALAKKRRK
jgi:hypothetical protein